MKNNRLLIAGLAVAALASAIGVQERGHSLRLEHYAEKARMAAYLQRDVVTEFGITSAEWDGQHLTIDGYLVKRACRLNSANPYAVVDFWKQDETGQRDHLPFAFNSRAAGRVTTTTRPPGSTNFHGWEIDLGPDATVDDVVVAYSQHNCGNNARGVPIIVGPREFLRVTPREAMSGSFVWRSARGE